ncbi:MAG: cytochrome c3 family protein [Bacteroidales bacterium]|nr:cytochrome c3 family protein [Bacteroidales bacterium]
MKTKFIFHILLMTAVVFLASCVKEGPAGVAGQDGQDGLNGTDGQDAVVNCTTCHTADKISSRQFQYASSGHKAGLYVGYAGGRASCAGCHSGTGFIQRIAEGSTTGAISEDIAFPEVINCETCHNLHSTFTYADLGLRGGGDVALIAGGTFSKTDGANICANCHQARRPEPNIEVPGETFEITSSHYGPHHGPQSQIFLGIGFAEIPGSVTYPAAGSSDHTKDASCVACHMGDYVNGEGGHTWHPNLSTCVECHGVDMDNFDYGGKQTVTLGQLEELRDLLITLGVVGGNDTDGYHPVTGTYPMVQAQAYFNWVGIEEDRSEGAHNPKYVGALLLNTIEAMKAEVAATK